MSLGCRALTAGLALAEGRHHRRLLAAAAAPLAAQTELLAKLLRSNADTAIGRQHGFARIAASDRPVADFRRAVPTFDYEDLRAWIERQERTGERCLTEQRPIYYNRTSGTVSKPKNIPVTASGLKRIRAQRRLAAYALNKGAPVMGGKIFAVTGQAVEGEMPGGTPYGSMSGLLYRQQSRLLRSRHVLPYRLAAIEDCNEQHFAMLAYGVAEPHVTCVGTANASTLLRLLKVLNDRAEELLRTVADGAMPNVGANASPQRSVAKRHPQPQRAAQLERRLASNGALSYADLWPALAGVVTWKGGSCGVAIGNLKPSLPEHCAVIELGYIASEVHATVNIDVNRDACLPTLSDTFFEFAERDAWEASSAGGNGAAADTLTLDELQQGHDYYVFVTTADGLYRYAMNDIVRVTGRIRQTPTLAFVQKGQGVTSITGEKLYEGQVLDAASCALAAAGVRWSFFIALANRQCPGYAICLESEVSAAGLDAVAADIDARLQLANIEYASKRRSGRLLPLRLQRLRPGTGDDYRAQRVAAGQRDAQFKYLHLQYADECSYDFAARCLPG